MTYKMIIQNALFLSKIKTSAFSALLIHVIYIDDSLTEVWAIIVLSVTV